MKQQSSFSEFELLLLLSILRLGDGAYGIPLCRELSAVSGRRVGAGSVYAALDRLETKGAVSSSRGESTPERGGRAKRYFQVTDQGLRSVYQTRKLLSELWQSLPPVAEELA